ncbi:MAG TPA: HlyD family efflux transporter periplasmic adaptor subunit, partial [Verrucomicrobia bacterium]|nr:HlyD family efflux transporter periplasmic adaptor subunit [Verrucomicrobiota bacterium]
MNAPEKTSLFVRLIKKSPLLSGLVLILLVAVSVMVIKKSGPPQQESAYYVVEKGGFLVSIVEGGNLEAVNEVVIRNEVEGSSRIIFIVPEGTFVEKDQLLVELDTADAEEKLNQQEINFQKSKATLIQAELNMEIQKSIMSSEIDAADLRVTFGKIELQKFDEGDSISENLKMESALTSTEGSLLLAENELDWAKKLFADGFETERNVNTSSNKVQNLKLNLAESLTNLWVLKRFSHPKQRLQNESDLEEAKKELERIKQQWEGKLAQYRADLINESNTLALNEKKLLNDREQMENSTIKAPQAGLVVYATSRSRFSSESMIEEGASVRNRQDIIKLPDTSEMKVELKIHESHINKIRKGLTAFIVLDSMPDKRYKGVVSKVAPLPDTQSRFGNPDLKVYKTEILITDDLPDLNPGV